MKLFRHLGFALALGAAFGPAAANEGNGLTVKPDELQWPRWQGRLSLSTVTPESRSWAISGTPNARNTSISLMGDYYLTGSLLGATRAGGFRATSGVMIGPRGQAWALPGANPTGSALSVDRRVFGQSTTLLPGDASAENPTMPYVGLGYTGLSPRGGWSFNADLGLMSLSAGGGVKLGRFVSGTQSLDDTLRDMRWSPVLQLGVSYSF